MVYKNHTKQQSVIGSVSTGFNFIGPNHRIDIEKMSDPLIPEVSCFVSMARRGGISGMVRDATGVVVVEEKNEKSIDCQRTTSGTITLTDAAKISRVVGRENRSILFNNMEIKFFYDKETNSGVYLAYTDTLIEGVPKSSMSVINFN